MDSSTVHSEEKASVQALARPTLSVVIPVFNGAEYLEHSLRALRDCGHPLTDLIVVDDGSVDESAEVAKRFEATVIRLCRNEGPALARNVGAREATGEILVFLDADAEVHADTLSSIEERFANEAELDALMGSYDDKPSDPGFISRYRNLLHCHTHQVSAGSSSTFWAGCGAVRREVFWAHGGFDQSVRCIEDIELGLRMAADGRRIALDPGLQVRHRKMWSLCSMVRTDVFVRAIPWTRLMLEHRRFPTDLNVRWSQRLSVLVAGVLFVLVSSWFWTRATAPLVAGVLVYIALNSSFLIFLARTQGPAFAVRSVPLHMLYHLYCGMSFAAGICLHALRQGHR